MIVRASFAHLTTFDAVARALSFTRAARRLHITQGAVSQRIRALEGDLGVQLFVRSTRAVRLTAAGEVLHRATRDALDRVEAGLVEMNALGKESQVTVSCSPSFAIRWLVPHLGALRIAAPEVNLHIAADDRLIAPGPGSVDVCIRYGQGGYGGRVRRICAEALRPVCNPLYLRHHPMRTPADLAGAMLLHDDVLADHPGHIGWQEWLSHAGVPSIDGSAGLRFSHSHLALDAAAAGQGI
ncbi:MAG TPA: LysR family transcriptional regulator, partial [Nannocystis exedens]|nr:LysR family transcriptional regulator [Nannocystis exedens]